MAGLAEMIHPGDLAAVNDAHQRAMRTRSSIVIEHRVVRGDGKVAHVRTYAEPLLVGDEVVGIWGTTQDISDAIADRDALLAEHMRRVSAETLAELASTLNGVTSPQELADATFETMERFADVTAVVLALIEVNEPILHQFYAGPGLAGDVRARYLRTPLAVDTHMTRVVNEQEPLFLRDRQAQMAEFPNIVTEVDRPGLESVAALPLRRASGTVLGALALGWSEPRDYDAESSATLREVAAVTGRTSERLELLDLERSVAETLQLGLLALDLRSTTAIVRARYRSSDATMEVGGDWYDAIELSGGRVALAVGDVVGRGLPAAATMGQLRAALGVTALHADDAAAAIEMLDKYANHVPGAKCATVALAIADASAQTVTYACAGHPPPLLVTPEGEARYLEGGRSWPLGVDTSRRRPVAATERLTPGALLLMYTDGLVERAGESLDVGFDRLRRVVAEHWNLPLRRLKQAIFRELIDDSNAAANDDIALVALRTVGSSRSHFVDAIHADPAEATATRHRLRAWLGDLGVDRESLDSLLLAVGEAVANAIDHGSRRDSSQIVKIELAANDGEIIAAISDSGRWQSGIEGYFTGRGRGHLLMQALTDAVTIDTDQHGTIVMLEFSCGPRSV
jgi:serine phosphatase RsbU (regulator of sigma subunit)/anti-sigma regulatory factor (Ser/Thr protein kinase)